MGEKLNDFPDIAVGDTISIFWENIPNIFKAQVINKPLGPGEFWIVREKNGAIHYIMNFSRISKERPPKDPITFKKPEFPDNPDAGINDF